MERRYWSFCLEKDQIPVLDYATYTPTSTWYPAISIVFGLAGAPVSYLLSWFCQSLLPMVLLSASALTFIYLAQKEIMGTQPGRRNILGVIGVVFVFLWAPAFLIVSAVLFINPSSGQWGSR
jgi:Mn2+/Fe2+ NRAMP family transporter